MEDLAIAFAGHGESSPKNTKALLDSQLLKDASDVQEFLIPKGIKARTQPGLASVVSYLAEEWGGDEEGEDPYTEHDPEDLVTELALTKADRRVLVVILGDDKPDEATARMIDHARDERIEVLDLAAGLDEYTVTKDAPAEDAADEPESEPEQPKRRRRGRARGGEEEPSEAVSEPRKTRGRPRTKAESDARAEKTLDDLQKVQDEAKQAEDKPPFDPPYKGQSGTLSLPDGVTADQVKGLLVVALEGALAALRGELRPQEETFAYIVDDEGTILKRRGRGKPSAGQRVEFLTKSEAAARGFEE